MSRHLLPPTVQTVRVCCALAAYVSQRLCF
ncbi:hypothetical protein R3I94_015110 [Phoxinus phoxinus]